MRSSANFKNYFRSSGPLGWADNHSLRVSSLLLEMVSSYGAVPVRNAEAPAEAARSSSMALKIAGAVMAGLMAAALVAAVATNSQVNGPERNLFG
jgi:hypothetical protein